MESAVDTLLTVFVFIPPSLAVILVMDKIISTKKLTVKNNNCEERSSLHPTVSTNYAR